MFCRKATKPGIYGANGTVSSKLHLSHSLKPTAIDPIDMRVSVRYQNGRQERGTVYAPAELTNPLVSSVANQNPT